VNSIWAVVPAAGSGRRLGGEIPKQYREIAGAPLMEHTLRALLESPDIRGIVVALDPSDRRADAIESLSDVRVQRTPGGAERADSVMAGDDAGLVTGTVDRASLWRAQTPQLFPLFPLRAALGQCFEEGVIVTDEAMAMEHVGQPVHVVEGPSSNIKVTVEADLAFADLVLRKRGAQ